MIKRWHVFVVLIIVAPVTIVIFQTMVSGGDSREESSTRGESRIIETPYYFANQFQRAIHEANQQPVKPTAEPIRAGIVPHDITQGQIIAKFFSLLQIQSPQRVVIVGPNHFERGGNPVLTTAATWRSGIGTTPADRDTIHWLVEQGYATEDDGVARDEHSIAGIVPYVSYYLPAAQVVPLILKAELRIADIERLAAALDVIVDEHTVVIMAVDFSHYLTSDEATQHDTVTERALRTLDYQTILSFGPQFNDYVDSPPSIGVLLFWLQKNKVTGVNILEHTNSGLLTGDRQSPVTSYFSVVYY